MADIATISKSELARMLEHTIILHPELPDEVFIDACEDVQRYKFGAFYVQNARFPLIADRMGAFCRDEGIELGIAPSGTGLTMSTFSKEDKLTEAKYMIAQGATAVDLVVDLPSLKQGDYKAFQGEIAECVKVCHDKGAVFKALLEVGYLTDEEIRIGTRLSAEAGADYVKTTVGNGPVGKTNLYQVDIMLDELKRIGGPTKLKATNGLIENVYLFLQAGAARCGSNNAILAVEALPLVQQRLFRTNGAA